MISQKITEVAAAVLQRPDGTFLLAQRPVGKAYEGYWEFPGGKIELGESPYQALCRELQEELGITVTTAYPWLLREFTYPHAIVRLHFFRVVTWQGEPHGRENQQLSWQRLSDISVAPILPANAPILRALSLPNVYAISNTAALGCDEFMLRLERALQNGLRLLQVREKKLSANKLLELSKQVVQLAHRFEAKVLINGDEKLAEEVGADGVHYSVEQLLSCTQRPPFDWCAVSCHNAIELRRAEELGFDFALLSPVLPTPSHPGEPHLGWENFSALMSETKIPIFALGGLTMDDLMEAQQYGAHGIALLSQAW
jgi:8-oxo-dGTP diphosphatase